MDNNDAIDSYEPYLAKLRAANDTAVSTFEEDWKTKRTRELAAEHAEIDASSAAALWPRLTAAELEEIPDPPDPYAAGIKALGLKEAR